MWIGALVVSVSATGCEPVEERSPERAHPVLPESRYTVLANEPAVRELPDESRAALATSPVPMVLLGVEYADRTRVMAGPRWCALTAHTEEGYSLSIHATDNWHDAPADPNADTPTATVRGRPAWETLNEAIRGLSWDENGVAYSLEIECDHPEGDTRCSEPEFLENVASHLVYGHAVTETELPTTPAVPGGSVDPVGGAR